MNSDIHAAMAQKSTDELVEIWKENDHSEWTDEAFVVVAELLLERMGSLPEQNKPIRDQLDSPGPAEELLVNFQRLLTQDILLLLIFWLCVAPAALTLIYLVIVLISLFSPERVPAALENPWFGILPLVLSAVALILRRRTKVASARVRKNLLEVISKGLEK